MSDSAVGFVRVWQRDLARAGGVVVVAPAVLIAILVGVILLGLGGFSTLGQLFAGPAIRNATLASGPVESLPVLVPAGRGGRSGASRGGTVSHAVAPAVARVIAYTPGKRFSPLPVRPQRPPQPPPIPQLPAQPITSAPPASAGPVMPPARGLVGNATAALGLTISGAGRVVGGVVSGTTSDLGSVLSPVSPQVGAGVAAGGATLGDLVDGVSQTLGGTVSGLGGAYSQSR